MFSIKPTSKCPRCGLRYAKTQNSCPHCSGLTDDDLRSIRLRHGMKQQAEWGKLLALIAAFILVIVLIVSLRG